MCLAHLYGEARAVIQDVASWDQTQETRALLKLLALANRDVSAEHVSPAEAVFERLRPKS